MAIYEVLRGKDRKGLPNYHVYIPSGLSILNDKNKIIKEITSDIINDHDLSCFIHFYDTKDAFNIGTNEPKELPYLDTFRQHYICSFSGPYIGSGNSNSRFSYFPMYIADRSKYGEKVQSEDISTIELLSFNKTKWNGRKKEYKDDNLIRVEFHFYFPEVEPKWIEVWNERTDAWSTEDEFLVDLNNIMPVITKEKFWNKSKIEAGQGFLPGDELIKIAVTGIDGPQTIIQESFRITELEISGYTVFRGLPTKLHAESILRNMHINEPSEMLYPSVKGKVRLVGNSIFKVGDMAKECPRHRSDIIYNPYEI